MTMPQWNQNVRAIPDLVTWLHNWIFIVVAQIYVHWLLLRSPCRALCPATVDQLVCRAPGTPPSQVWPLSGRIYLSGVAQFTALKKISLIRPTSKHKYKAGPISQELRCRCVRVGWGFWSFLDMCEGIFFLQHNTMGAVLLPTGRGFFHGEQSLVSF